MQDETQLTRIRGDYLAAQSTFDALIAEWKAADEAVEAAREAKRRVVEALGGCFEEVQTLGRVLSEKGEPAALSLRERSWFEAFGRGHAQGALDAAIARAAGPSANS